MSAEQVRRGMAQRYDRYVSRFCLLLSVALACIAGQVRAAEPPTEPILRIDPGEHTSSIRRIATDAAGRWLVTASLDKTVKVWSLADGRLVSTLRHPIGAGSEGNAYAVALSPEGQTVAVGGFTQFNDGATNSVSRDGFTIYLFDRASGRLQRRLTGLPEAVIHLAFSHDGRILAATLGNKNGLRLFDVADGRLLAEDRDYGDTSSSVHFSADNRLVTTSYDGLLRLYRVDGARLTLLIKQRAPGGRLPFAARFSPDGKRIAVGFADNNHAVNVLDGNNLNLLFAPDTAGVNSTLHSIDWSQGGTALYAAGNAARDNQRFIRRWSGGGAGTAIDWPVAGSMIMDLAELPDGRLAFGSIGPSWGVVSATGERVLFHAPVVADFRNNLEGFKLSRDGAQVRFAYESFGKSPAVFNSVVRQFLAEDASNLLPPTLSAFGLDVTDWHNTVGTATVPKLKGAPLKLFPGEISYSAAIAPGGEGFVLGTNHQLRAYERTGNQRWVIPSRGGIVWSLNVSQDGRWVVAAYGDGTIRWHRATDGAEQLAFYPHPDRRRWVLWSPSGYYDAAPGAEDLIGWHLNRGKEQAADFFPASRFRGRFYRPDVIARVLETRDETEALRLANLDAGRKPQAVAIVQALPPVVEILSPQSGTAISEAELTLNVAVRAPSDAPVTSMRVRVNGLLQPDTRNLAVSKVTGSDTREIAVRMPQSDADIQVFAENRNGVSVPATLRVNWADPNPTTATSSAVATPGGTDDAIKPKLYVLAVGLSKYKNPDYNLGLPAKDAKDTSDAFRRQKGLLYRDVEVKLLTDAQATKDEVLDGLEWLKRQVTSRDIGILFLAGHGVNDAANNYFFLPYNTDADKLLRTGVAYNDIKLTLGNIAGKALFFIDTCHSGNVLGGAKTRGVGSDINAVVSDLASAENGVVVFTASTGRQLAQENAAWGNGAFTKALVEGLSGKADYRKTGTITHKGLDFYVTERVKELTKGQQSPVSIAPQGVTDFPIAVVRK